MNGSRFFRRTMDFVPGFEETTTGEQIRMAITYEHIGGQIRVTGYRNDEQIGQYTSGSPSTWATGDAEVFFGLRHGNTGGGPGGLDALIDEGRIYNTALAAQEISELTLVEIPEPSTLLLAAIGLLGLGMARRQRRRAAR
ncbi:MAG: PEP-CTERM sorting domain-containing protein [Planctomycetes bacterium]|nr:PEP-CTERM sorting domain-containing protein [Planctomycetota bacterium]